MILSKELKAKRPGLVKIVERHLPGTVGNEATSPNEPSLSNLYADRLLLRFRMPEEYFGFSSKTQTAALQRLVRAATEVKRSVLGLSDPMLERINARANDPLRPEVPALYECYYLAGVVGEEVSKMLHDQKKMPEASGSRDWKMAAIAGTCREIWAAEKWRSDPQVYGPVPTINALLPGYYTPENRAVLERYHYHLRTFAPRYEKPDAPGPLGRLIEDVLRVVGEYEKGKSPSAQSALRSWRDAVDNSPQLQE